MPLAAGTALGPYEIVGVLGAGGMGEVYRARDARLGRDVAIKVLPAGFASDPDRRARFEREARAVAALSHPNILAIHDFGEAAGPATGDGLPTAGQGATEGPGPRAHGPTIHYIVTELLDGETLRERLGHGPLPVRKAVDVAVQIARGLAAAHDKGLVHRDLKPENVFLLPDGQVKVLDFGLARQATADNSGATETAAMTDPGTVMGTVGYMAPEQVRGQAVDARTDLFAFGAVLYEMLSGRRAFQRDTAADTITAILREEPPELAASRTDLSPALDRIVRHCLEKNPAERFQAARDVAFALEALSGSATSIASGALPAAVAATGRWRVPALLALVAVMALAAGVLLDRVTRPAASAVAFESKTWDSEWITNARFAPDGQTIVFSAAPTGAVPRLFVIRPGTVTSQPFGPPATHLLSVSSTGELAVLTDARPLGHRLFGGTLARMTMDGAVRPWMQRVVEADWSPDGSTLAITRRTEAGMQLEYPVGHALYHVTSGYLSDLRVAPDGSRVAFFEHQIAGDDRGWVKVVDASGVVTPLAGEYWGEEGLAWSPDSNFVYFSASARGGEAFQPLVVNTRGTPVARQALASAGAMWVQDVNRDGKLLVMRDDLRSSIRARVPGETAEREFSWLDYAYEGYLSRDGKVLVFGDESQSAGANYAVALRHVDSTEVVRLGQGEALPLSPDGKWAPALVPSSDEIAFYPTGPGDPLKLARGGVSHYRSGLQWFPDGKRVLICGTEAPAPPRCYAQQVPTGAPKAVTPDNATSALVAPDARTLLIRMADNTFAVTSIGSGTPPVPAKGLTPEDSPVAWTSDGRAVVVMTGIGVPERIDRVDPVTGQRTLLTLLAPPDVAGVNGVFLNQWIDDGQGYVYSYFRELSKLFVATGVKP